MLLFMRTPLLLATLLLVAFNVRAEEKIAAPKIRLVVHGGAGIILKQNMTPEKEKEYTEKLSEALRAGWKSLKRGGSSTDAVVASITILENSPLFNAGKGAVFTHEGRNELDAAIMDGQTKKAGAVAGVTIIKNPILAARAVMDKSPHVMMTGRGAELFATQMGLEIVDPSYFWTKDRWEQLQKQLVEEEKAKQGKPGGMADAQQDLDEEFGTVGAVALDQYGNLAAGTSTGGMTNKKFGRIGDSPIIGAGTYADNETCAVSGTGHGEFFIRYTVAHEIAALMKYKGLSVAAAADQVVNHTLKDVGGDGGVIALDAKGNFAMPFNSAGMYRGFIGDDGVPHVQIYKD